MERATKRVRKRVRHSTHPLAPPPAPILIAKRAGIVAITQKMQRNAYGMTAIRLPEKSL
jgi:hypothetical protein